MMKVVVGDKPSTNVSRILEWMRLDLGTLSIRIRFFGDGG